MVLRACLGLLLVLCCTRLSRAQDLPSGASTQSSGTSQAPALHVDTPRAVRRAGSDIYWFEYHGIDAPDGVKLPSDATAYCPPPQYVVAINVTVANVTAVPADWPHLLAGLDAEATQPLPKEAVVRLDVTCGNATHTTNSTSLRPRPGELAKVPVSMYTSAPGPAPVAALPPSGAAAQLQKGTVPLAPGQRTSAQAQRTVNGSLTLDTSTNRTTTLSAWGPGIEIVGFSRIATVAGTWGWVSNVTYPEPHGLVSGSNSAEWYYGDYNVNENLAYDVTWLDVCPPNTRVIAVEARPPGQRSPGLLKRGLWGLLHGGRRHFPKAYMAAGAVLGLSWGCGCIIKDCYTSVVAENVLGSTKNSNCSCAPFFNVTSGSGLVVTESGGACILSDSAVPWCVVNISTCASPRTVRRNRGEPWDYCTDVAGKRALIYSYAAKALPAPAGQGVPLAPILGSVIPAAVLAMLAALAAAWWWRRSKEKKTKLGAAPSSKGRLPQDSDAILTPKSSGPFPVNMENVEEYMVKPADFQILRRKDGSDWLLGQGAFGKVYRGLLEHVQPVAIKVIPAGIVGATPRASAETLREITLLRQCRCPHIVQFMGACILENGDTVILMELMLGGTLFEAIATDRVSWHNRGRQVAIDVARGLAFLHSRNIASLDVKSPNVLLTPTRSAKIADFGLARVLLTAATAVTACGSFDWAAPELLMGGTSSKVSSAADIYSFGVVLWELVTREAPRRGRMRVPRAPEECPQDVVDLINECLAVDASARPTARELVERLLGMRRGSETVSGSF